MTLNYIVYNKTCKKLKFLSDKAILTFNNICKEYNSFYVDDYVYVTLNCYNMLKKELTSVETDDEILFDLVKITFDEYKNENLKIIEDLIILYKKGENVANVLTAAIEQYNIINNKNVKLNYELISFLSIEEILNIFN